MTKTLLIFEAGDNSKEYEIKIIWDSAVYARELDGHL